MTLFLSTDINKAAKYMELDTSYDKDFPALPSRVLTAPPTTTAPPPSRITSPSHVPSTSNTGWTSATPWHEDVGEDISDLPLLKWIEEEESDDDEEEESEDDEEEESEESDEEEVVAEEEPETPSIFEGELVLEKRKLYTLYTTK